MCCELRSSPDAFATLDRITCKGTPRRGSDNTPAPHHVQSPTKGAKAAGDQSCTRFWFKCLLTCGVVMGKPYIHTYTHTHTCTHTHTQLIHAHAHAHARAHTHTHTDAHTHIHAHTRTHAHIRTHTHMYTRAQKHTHAAFTLPSAACTPHGWGNAACAQHVQPTTRPSLPCKTEVNFLIIFISEFQL